MSTTVGLLAPNGNVGAAALRHLIPFHKDGKIHIVVLHRPGSPPNLEGLSDVQPAVDVREVDLEGDFAQIESAVKGINVLISAITATATQQQIPLVEAFAKSPSAVTFIPSRYASVRFSAEDAEVPAIKGFESMLNGASEKATELGLGVTRVDSGAFDLFFFGVGLESTSIKNNTLSGNSKQLKHPFPITSVDYLGAAIATLVSTNAPQSIANKKFSAIEIFPTGNELVDVFTKVHDRKPTQVIDYTAEDSHKLFYGENPMGAVVAGYLKNWEENSWKVEEPIEVKGYKKSTTEEMARRFLE